MVNDIIKNQIIEELQPSYKNLNIESNLLLLINLLEQECSEEAFQGIRHRYPQAIEAVFDPDASFSRATESASTLFKVEPVFKLILFYSDEYEYRQSASLEEGLSGVINRLGINPENLNLNKPREYYAGRKNYIEQTAITYQLRNTEAHSCKSWSRKELYNNIDAVLISLIYCVSIKRKAIAQRLIMHSLNKESVSNYMSELTSYFKNKMKKFIMLNGEENLKLADRFICEDTEEPESEDDKPRGRSGRIDELRERSIPEKRLMIWGEAGTGKSTTLEYLAYVDAQKWIRDNYAVIPVLVSLGLLVSKDVSIKQYISSKLNIQESVIERLLEAGQLNLFLDGLNEIPNNNQLKSIRLREIRDLINRYKKCFIILSDRPSEGSSFQRTPDLPIFNLVKLSDEQIEVFLQKNAENPNTISIVSNAVEQNGRLKEIVRTPLMFSRLIDIVDATGKVPTSEGAIIGGFTQLRIQKTELTLTDTSKYDFGGIHNENAEILFRAERRHLYAGR